MGILNSLARCSVHFSTCQFLQERKQVEELVAKIAEEDAKEAKARSDKQVEFLGESKRGSKVLGQTNTLGPRLMHLIDIL